MATAQFGIHKQIAGRSAYAQVRVRILEKGSGTASVAVSDQAFAWLKTEYGPDAWEWPVCDDYRSGAIAGVQIALTSSEPHIEASIVIEEIRAHPAHSDREVISYVSAMATWRALGVRPARSLTIWNITMIDEP